jgi:hypothetical protein
MGYAIAIVLVVLIIGGFVTFLAMNAAGKSDVADADDPGADSNPLSIIGSDDTPVGDTNEHAGEQNREGETVGQQDADAHGGTGRAVSRGYAATGGIGESGKDDPDVARPVVGGEAEGERSVP